LGDRPTIGRRKARRAMRGRLFQLGVFLVAAGVLIGCKTPGPVQTKEHPDPLIVSKKPIEGRAHNADPEEIVRVDPQAPLIPNQPGGAIVRRRAPLGTPQPLQAGLE
jgi:hypothetical protein